MDPFAPNDPALPGDSHEEERLNWACGVDNPAANPAYESEIVDDMRGDSIPAKPDQPAGQPGTSGPE